MSQTTDDDGVRMRKQHSKTTNIVVYLDTDTTDVREAMIDVAGSEYSDKETEVKDEVRVEIGDTSNTLYGVSYSDLPRGDTGGVSVSVERSVSDHYVKSEGGFCDEMFGGAISNCLENLAVGTPYSKWLDTVRNPDREAVVRVRKNDPTVMGLIAHKPDVDQGVVWDDKDAEMMAVTITVECKDTSQEIISMADEHVVEGLRDRLLRYDSVRDVRYRACEVEETERGDCFDVFN